MAAQAPLERTVDKHTLYLNPGLATKEQLEELFAERFRQIRGRWPGKYDDAYFIVNRVGAMFGGKIPDVAYVWISDTRIWNMFQNLDEEGKERVELIVREQPLPSTAPGLKVTSFSWADEVEEEEFEQARQFERKPLPPIFGEMIFRYTPQQKAIRAADLADAGAVGETPDVGRVNIEVCAVPLPKEGAVRNKLRTKPFMSAPLWVTADMLDPFLRPFNTDTTDYPSPNRTKKGNETFRYPLIEFAPVKDKGKLVEPRRNYVIVTYSPRDYINAATAKLIIQRTTIKHPKTGEVANLTFDWYVERAEQPRREGEGRREERGRGRGRDRY